MARFYRVSIDAYGHRLLHSSFFSSLSQFHTFVDPIQAGGGGDGPEDVMGGLKVSLTKLNWQTSSAKVN